MPVTCPYSEPDQSSSCSLSNLLKIHLNSILPTKLWCSKWSLSLRFPHQNPLCNSPFPHTCHMRRRSHSSRYDDPNNIWCGVQIINSSLRSFPHFSVTSSLLGPNILLNTLFSKTLRLVPPWMWATKFTPIRNDRLNYNSILNFIVLDSKLPRMITSIPWLRFALNFFQNHALFLA